MLKSIPVVAVVFADQSFSKDTELTNLQMHQATFVVVRADNGGLIVSKDAFGPLRGRTIESDRIEALVKERVEMTREVYALSAKSSCT